MPRNLDAILFLTHLFAFVLGGAVFLSLTDKWPGRQRLHKDGE